MLEAITTYINESYGSKSGLLHHWWFGLQYRLGRFSKYAAIDWSRVENLVFICHGNICRSPLGEAMARQQFHLQTESFGLDCRDGAPADPRAIKFAADAGIDLTNHASRHVRAYKPAVGDLVIAMEPKHLAQLSASIVAIAQITLIGLWKPAPQPYVHDPYSSEECFFVRCEQSVVDGVKGVAKLWQSNHL